MMKVNGVIYLFAFVFIYLSLRIFWIGADNGVFALWEYGHHLTDEGFYLSGGKEMFLRGGFVDSIASSCSTYSYSPLTHWIEYLSCQLFGLSHWKHRIIFLLIYLSGWLSIYKVISKLSGPLFSFVAVVTASSLPMVVDSERAMTNDAVTASVAAIAFAVAVLGSRKHWSVGCLISAFVISLSGLIKPSVWLLIPFVFSGLLVENRACSRWKMLLLFVFISAMMIYGYKALAMLALRIDWSLQGWKVVELPSVFDVCGRLRDLSTFPRGKIGHAFGSVLPFLIAVPCLAAIIKCKWKQFDWRFWLYISIPIYAGSIAVLDFTFAHYWHPAWMMLPVLFVALCDDFTGEKMKLSWERKDTLRLIIFELIMLVVYILVVLQVPEYAKDNFPGPYRPPLCNLWRFGWKYMALITCGYFVACGVQRTLGLLPVLIMSSGVIATSMTLNSYRESIHGLLLFDFLIVLPILVLWIRYGVLPVKTRWFGLVIVLYFGVSVLVAEPWRSAVFQLLERPTYYEESVAIDIEHRISSNAIVFGMTADQVLLGTRIRSGSQVADYKYLDAAFESLAKYPDIPVYMLFDDKERYLSVKEIQYCAPRMKYVASYFLPSMEMGRRNFVRRSFVNLSRYKMSEV